MVDCYSSGVNVVTGHRTVSGVSGGAVDVDQRHSPVMAKRGAWVGFALHNKQTVNLQRQ